MDERLFPELPVIAGGVNSRETSAESAAISRYLRRKRGDLASVAVSGPLRDGVLHGGYGDCGK